MSATRKQKLREHMAKLCQEIAGNGKKSVNAILFRAKNRLIEKRKRAQFRGHAK